MLQELLDCPCNALLGRKPLQLSADVPWCSLSSWSSTSAPQRGFCHPQRQAGGSALLPSCAVIALIGTPPCLWGFLSMPIPVTIQHPWCSPVPRGIFRGFRFAFPCNTWLDKEIGVSQAKGTEGINKLLLPWGDKHAPFPPKENGIC